MNKHTPGPWIVRGKPGNRFIRTEIIGGKATTVAWIDSLSAEAELPNARLIAAAPDLLAACELAIDLFQFGTFDNGVHSPSGESEAEHWAGRCREKMASAIAKAKGTS